eukprot:3228962-Pyramimonas_sp.AAC.1
MTPASPDLWLPGSRALPPCLLVSLAASRLFLRASYPLAPCAAPGRPAAVRPASASCAVAGFE